MLTADEAQRLNAELAACVARYTSGTSPSPTPTPPETPAPTPTPPPSGYTPLAWPTKTQGYTRKPERSPCHLTVSVPLGAANGPGRIQISPVAGDNGHRRSLKLSATPGGPPLTIMSYIPSSTTPTVSFYIGTPEDRSYAQLHPGTTYYADCDDVEGFDPGPMVVDLYVSF